MRLHASMRRLHGAVFSSSESCRPVLTRPAAQKRRQPPIRCNRVAPAATSAAQSAASDLPDGLPAVKSQWRKYETLLCLSTAISDEQRDQTLARLESFLLNKNAEDVKVDVKGPYTLAYPIKRNDLGTYALFTYTARRHVAKDIEYLLSHPEAGTEDFVLRYKTFVR